jgi:hypothetical protein
VPWQQPPPWLQGQAGYQAPAPYAQQWQTGQLPWQPPIAKKKRSPILALSAGGVVVALVLISIGLISKSQEIKYPKVWAAEAQPLVTFIETTRGKPFKHPVEVSFLDPAAFDAEVLPSDGPMQWKTLEVGQSAPWVCATRGDTKGPCDDGVGTQIDPEQRAKRLLGLEDITTPTSINLAKLRGGDITGIYLSRTKRILVRGKYTAAIAPTLIHELNHAWQDQLFRLNALDDSAGSDETMAARSLFEGDSMRIERAYVASLSQPDRTKLNDAYDQEAQTWDQAEADNAKQATDVEQFVTMRERELDYVSFPYDEGRNMVADILDQQGEAGLQNALQQPPRRTAEVLHPDVYLQRIVDGKDPAAEQERLKSGLAVSQAHQFHNGTKTLGEQLNRLILKADLGEDKASALAASIRTDAYVVYWTNGQVCIDVGWVFDTDTTGIAAREALSTWVTARTGHILSTPTLTSTAAGLKARVCELGI